MEEVDENEGYYSEEEDAEEESKSYAYLTKLSHNT